MHMPGLLPGNNRKGGVTKLIKFFMQLAFLLFIASFLVIFGVQVATQGMAAIEGGQSAAVMAKPTEKAVSAPVVTPSPAVLPTPSGTVGRQWEKIRDSGKEPALTHAADKFGQLLQIIADHSIDLVVSALNHLFG